MKIFKNLGRALLLLLLLFLASPLSADSNGPTTLQNAATTTGVGVLLPVDSWTWKTVNIVLSAGTATILVQGTIDNSTWETIASLSASGTVSNNDAWLRMRANISACTGCTVTAKAFLAK